jgi:hypothetical protein
MLYLVDPFAEVNWSEVSKSFPKNPEDAWGQSSFETSTADVWGQTTSLPASNGLGDIWSSNTGKYVREDFREVKNNNCYAVDKNTYSYIIDV